MSVSFNQIPISVRTPGQFGEIDNANAVQGTPALPHTSLLCGQMLAGSATAGQVYLISGANETSLFGYNSVIARMCRRFKQQNPLGELFAVGLADDGAAVDAAGTFTFSGTATEAGEIALYFGGRRVTIAVAVGDTITELDPLAIAAINAATDRPCVASQGTGVVDVTALNGGTVGNELKLGVCLQDGEAVPAGIAVAVVQPASGANDPDFDDLVAAMGDEWYHTVGLGISSATEIAKVVTELETRWEAMNQIEGQIFAAKTGSQGSLTTYGNSFNSFALSAMGIEISGLTLPVEEVAALVAAESAKQAQIDPARAFTGLGLKGAKAAHKAARFTRSQRDVLLSDGVSTVKAGSDGSMRLDRMITTYQTNPSSGLLDPSYMDLTTMRNLAYLRYSVRSRIALKFSRHKLADDGNVIPAGQPIVTPSTIRDELIALFLEWQGNGLVENLDQYIEQILVERDVSDPNRINAILPPDLINNLLVFAFKLAFIR